MSTTTDAGLPLPSIVAFVPRDRTRTMMKAAFPRRRCRLLLVRTAADFNDAFRKELVDAAIVDVTAAHDETWTVAHFAREYPSAPFFALATMRAAEGPAIAQCAELEFADVLVEGVDDACARELVTRRGFSGRFAAALETPPPALALTTPVQHKAWEFIVAHAGRRVRKDERSEEHTSQPQSQAYSVLQPP